MTNLFCNSANLVNEADVEQNFVRRLLEHLGYTDGQIKPKNALTQLSVGAIGKKEALYRPDFALKVAGKVRWVVEAKAPKEGLDEHYWQPRSYCSLINGQYQNENPVKYFVLTNAKETRLYKADVNKPVMTLAFSDFKTGNQIFAKFIALLKPDKFGKPEQEIVGFELSKRSIAEVNAAFAWCHQEIYRKDNISQSGAFTEFVKVIFLKLLSDRRIKERYPELLFEETVTIPLDDVKFSTEWINAQDTDIPNPLDEIQFRSFINKLEKEIAAGRRKRIFDADERIKLSPETIKSVVGRIEHIFLFGIDADLNGRLFETFLNATMRGKDLGQYFTPRSVVKLATRLAGLKVNALLPDGTRHTDKVIDACCGTGGFLIEALAVMFDRVNRNSSLSRDQKDALLTQIANHHIYGVDIAKDPQLARIARLNMYLHGDGGSSIFQTDFLDKILADAPEDQSELLLEKKQLKKLFKPEGFADVVITNPPFAKIYERKTPSERRILDEYRLAFDHSGNEIKQVKSNLLFIERYYDVLKPGGRMLTVLDDGILSGGAYREFRAFMRANFIVKAVVSLPGDAFQRSKARVKTSILILEKRNPEGEQQQPSVFMYGCEWVGIDDPARQRAMPIDKINRAKATDEIRHVVALYESFLQGNGDPAHVVAPDRITDRLDVKSCLYAPGRGVVHWTEEGRRVVHLRDILEEAQVTDDVTIRTKESDEMVSALRVSYSGFATADPEMPASETTYSELYRVYAGQIVISNIAATYGSIVVVPAECDGCVVSNEYTVLDVKTGLDPEIAWVVLRSSEARADMLLLATGANRTRVSWPAIKEIQVALPHKAVQTKVTRMIRESETARRHAAKLHAEAYDMANDNIAVPESVADSILRAFKPPK